MGQILNEVKEALLKLEPGTKVWLGRRPAYNPLFRLVLERASVATVRKALSALSDEHQFDERGDGRKTWIRLSDEDRCRIAKLKDQRQAHQQLIDQLKAAGINATAGRHLNIQISQEDAGHFLRLLGAQSVACVRTSAKRKAAN